MLAAAVASGEALEIVEDGVVRGVFFIRLHLCPDLKAMKVNFNISCKITVITNTCMLKGVMGLRGGALSDPCPVCEIPGDQGHMGDLDATWPHRLKKVWGIPIERIHPCTLHCLCRVGEKILHVMHTERVFQWLSEGDRDPQLKDKSLVMCENYLGFLNTTLNVNGGKCLMFDYSLLY